eukprot:5954910-Pyramimonas_sp.AAC.1
MNGPPHCAASCCEMCCGPDLRLVKRKYLSRLPVGCACKACADRLPRVSMFWSSDQRRSAV